MNVWELWRPCELVGREFGYPTTPSFREACRKLGIPRKKIGKRVFVRAIDFQNAVASKPDLSLNKKSRAGCNRCGCESII